MGDITISHIAKAYKRYPNKWSRILEWVTGREQHQKNWVLRDISFSVTAGEAIGIVGMNGAGKSTLLKIITGTTQPTKGTAQLQGRVAALLELGMGFHPDFTGRQNTFMAGQLLGLRTEEVAACMAEIEAFAEIGDYIDRPVRTYSSGMQVRLAFSVATAVRPDILIVDEALSVGDTYFQHKSFSRIREFREQGTTLLIVSHDRSAIQSLCNRAILLENGLVVQDGPPEAVMDFYNALIADKKNASITVQHSDDGRAQTSSGTGEARVESITLCNEQGDIIESANVGQTVTLRASIRLHADLPELVMGYMIKDRLGQTIFGTNTHHLDMPLNQLQRGDSITLQFSFALDMGPGTYSICTALHTAESHLSDNYEWRDLALLFHVININRQPFVGTSWMPPQVQRLQ